MKDVSSNKYMCGICKFSFGFDSMTYSGDGKKLICKNCYNIIAKKNKKPALQEIRAGSQEALSEPGRMKVMCISCKYKFFLRKGSRVEPKCPYCGKNRLAKYDELTADRLLNEASKDRDFY